MVIKTHSVYLESHQSFTHLEDIANQLNIHLNKTLFQQKFRFENDDLKHLESDFDALQMTPQSHSNHVEILESSNMRESK